MPVVYYSTLMAVAYGRNVKDAALDGQIIPAKKLDELAGKVAPAASSARLRGPHERVFFVLASEYWGCHHEREKRTSGERATRIPTAPGRFNRLPDTHHPWIFRRDARLSHPIAVLRLVAIGLRALLSGTRNAPRFPQNPRAMGIHPFSPADRRSQSVSDMSNNSDPRYEQYVDMDFTDAMPVAEVPALAKLQAERSGTSPVTLPVDSAILSTINAYGRNAKDAALDGQIIPAKKLDELAAK